MVRHYLGLTLCADLTPSWVYSTITREILGVCHTTGHSTDSHTVNDTLLQSISTITYFKTIVSKSKVIQYSVTVVQDSLRLCARHNCVCTQRTHTNKAQHKQAWPLRHS